MGRDQVIAENIDLARLPFPLAVQLFDEQTESLMSLALAHIPPGQ